MTLAPVEPVGATVDGVTHYRADVDGTTLHVVGAGSAGSPVLLVHGFPENWWTFHALVPLLAAEHRVFAVDLRGWGDSSTEGDDFGHATAAEDLHRLVGELGLGPVHLCGQDISGDTVLRLAAQYPADVASLTVIEAGLSGFGLEAFADVAHGGAWHFGAIATPGVAEFVFSGRVRRYLAEMWFPAMARVPGAVDDVDLDEFTRVLSRPDAWRGPHGLYSTALSDGPAVRALAPSVTAPVLAVDGVGYPNTVSTLQRAVTSTVVGAHLDGVGHHVALEAPDRLAAVVLEFLRGQD